MSCRYFSYEHFYVVYCRFWELDTDHDFFIGKENLIKYGNHSLTYRIVDRIFCQVYCDSHFLEKVFICTYLYIPEKDVCFPYRPTKHAHYSSLHLFMEKKNYWSVSVVKVLFFFFLSWEGEGWRWYVWGCHFFFFP